MKHAIISLMAEMLVAILLEKVKEMAADSDNTITDEIVNALEANQRKIVRKLKSKIKKI